MLAAVEPSIEAAPAAQTHEVKTMPKKINARFYVQKFDKQIIGRVSNEDPTPLLQAQVTLAAVTRKDTEDNVDWAKYSPSGQITLSVSQVAGGAFEAFEALLGHDVAVTFTEIEGA